MTFCARDIYGFYMLAPRNLYLEPVQKIQLIQSQSCKNYIIYTRISISFAKRNDDSYITLNGTVIRFEKLARRDHFNSSNKCVYFK